MRKGIVVSVLNHKGGVMKTTVTINLAAALARTGKKVLVVDLDAQQNLTMGLIGLVAAERGKPSLYDAMIDETGFDDLIQHTSTAGLDIVPVTEEFVAADLSLVSMVGRELVLRECLRKTTKLSEYDLVLLDNPPSISLVVMNALCASDYFIVPCSAEFYSTVGLSLLARSIDKLAKFTSGLQPLGVIVTLYNRSESIHRQTDQAIRKELPGSVFEARIRVNTKGKVAPSRQKTIFQHENRPDGRGTEDFTHLATEFLERLEARENLTLQQAVNG